MAVAPIVDGKPDTSQIVIAYAGTNDKDVRDLLIDVQMIAMGDTQHVITNKKLPSQAKTALAYADQIEAKYPDAHITTTGHSLGASLSMYVSLKRSFANISFNGPDIANIIMDEEIDYMQKHPHKFRNYRHLYDDIGNITGAKTKTAIYPKVIKGKEKLSKTLNYNFITKFPSNDFTRK